MASSTSLLPIEAPARDPLVGWWLAVVFASVVTAGGAVFGADIVRSYIGALALLGEALGIAGGAATLYERIRCRADLPARPIASAAFVE